MRLPRSDVSRARDRIHDARVMDPDRRSLTFPLARASRTTRRRPRPAPGRRREVAGRGPQHRGERAKDELDVSGKIRHTRRDREGAGVGLDESIDERASRHVTEPLADREPVEPQANKPARLTAPRTAGTDCHSSSSTGSGCTRRAASGSARNAAASASRSRRTTVVASRSAAVVFPAARGPTRRTAGSWAKSAVRPTYFEIA